MATVEEVQKEITNGLKDVDVADSMFPPALQFLRHLRSPEGCTPRVTFKHRDGDRKVKRNASFENCDRSQLRIVIEFESKFASDDALDWQPGNGRQSRPAAESEIPASDETVMASRLTECLRALRLVEQNRDFVALKWFRDEYLMQQSLSWVEAKDDRQVVIATAIRRGWVLTHKVANPYSPDYPVTAIRANLDHPEVQEVLEYRLPRAEFKPIELRSGEPLSATILKERR